MHASVAERLRSIREGHRALEAEVDGLEGALADAGAPVGQAAPSPFHHYNASFDPVGLIRKYERKDRGPADGLVTNFLGVRVDPGLFGDLLKGHAGHVEPLPIPANWHADISEWGAALRAVDEAVGTVRIVELGCGWGCWLNNLGMAARSAGLDYELIGIEGDEDHVASAIRTLELNGFPPDRYRILHGVAAPRRGTALFPIVADPGGSWGSAPVLDAGEERIREARRTGGYAILEAMPLRDLSGDGLIDLLHIDIQGGEVDFVTSNFGDIDALVKRVLIGTHSRSIEGRLVDHMMNAGWLLEIERPAIVDLTHGRPETRVDGVQLFANPRLLNRPTI